MNHENTLKDFLRKRRNESVADKTLDDDKAVISKFLSFVGDQPLS